VQEYAVSPGYRALRVVRASERRFETEDVKVVRRRRHLQDRLRLGIGKFDHAVMPNPSVKKPAVLATVAPMGKGTAPNA